MMHVFFLIASVHVTFTYRWPAIICSDITPDNYAWFDIEGDVKYYHVEYFGDPRTHSWVLAKHVEVYGSGNAPSPVLIVTHKAMTTARSRKSFQKAVLQADKLTSLSPAERLSHCVFHSTDVQSKEPLRNSETYAEEIHFSNPKASGTKRELNLSSVPAYGAAINVKQKRKRGRRPKAEGLASDLRKGYGSTSSPAVRGRKRQTCRVQSKENVNTKKPNQDGVIHTELSDKAMKQCTKLQADAVTTTNTAFITSIERGTAVAENFSQTGICLLNINGVVVPAILPVDKVKLTGSDNLGQIQCKVPSNNDKTFSNGISYQKSATNINESFVKKSVKRKCQVDDALKTNYTVPPKQLSSFEESPFVANQCNQDTVRVCKYMSEGTQAKTTNDVSSKLKEIKSAGSKCKGDKSKCKNEESILNAGEQRQVKGQQERCEQEVVKDQTYERDRPWLVQESPIESTSHVDKIESQAEQLNSKIESLLCGQPLLKSEDEMKLKRLFKLQFSQHADMIRLDAKERCIRYERKQLDMYRFYSLVKEAGGFKKASKSKNWQSICKEVTGSNTDSKFLSLKKCYQRTLLRFEQYMKSLETTSYQQSLDERSTADVHVIQSYEESKKRQEIIDFVDHGVSFASQETDVAHIQIQNSHFSSSNLEANVGDQDDDIILSMMNTQVNLSLDSGVKLDEPFLSANMVSEVPQESDDVIDHLMGLKENELSEQVFEEFENLQQQLEDEELSLYNEEEIVKLEEHLKESASNDISINLDEDSSKLFEELTALDETISMLSGVLDA
ncbi:uncharacterized protein LOC135682610 [Rhopilema esculentum]|uniref:uncharacterized protein LOC135682610 n=1 Tax=Rhopilema esculentum TaxID=499914 RepID=UPI0031D4D2AE